MNTDQIKMTLHMHSRFSDGADTVEELIAKAKEQGMTHIAITDHDTFAGMRFINKLKEHESFDIELIGGCEFSCSNPHTGDKVHILAYGLDLEQAEELEKIASHTLMLRHQKTLWQIQQIMNAGYDLSVDSVREESKDSPVLYKQHVMFALTKHRYSYNSSDYMNLYRSLFKGSGVAVGEIEYPSALEIVRLIKEAGGYSVLAHPGQLNSYPLIEELVKEGLDGIEKYHHSHGEADYQKVDDFAQTYQLFTTAGTDYHGRYGSPERIDEELADADQAALLVDLLFN